MKRDGVQWVQRTCIVLAISLVASFFIFGMPHGDQGQQAQPRSSQPSGPTSPEPKGSPQPNPSPTATSTDELKPGVPLTPISEMETWPDKDNQDADRELDYQPSGTPSVELPDALSDDLTGYWNQQLRWEACDSDQCATVKVPLDWENPGLAAVDIRIRKIPSANPTHGPLFVNPGGPGFGGQDYATSLGADAYEGYDIVGWDPRGTGESTTVKCGTTEQTDAMFQLDGTPGGPDELGPLTEGFKNFAHQCRDASGELLDHLTTIENARDLDLIRALMGADKLNFLGVSYGTFVGSVYAQLFPERVGRMVLDSAVDISNSDDAPAQVEGFELALNNYAKSCANDDRCTLGSSAEEVTGKIGDFLQGLDSAPLQVGDRTLTQELATTGIALFLYSDERAYPALTAAIQEGLAGRGGALLQAADQLNGRGPTGYNTEAFAFPATACVDGIDQGIQAAYQNWREVIPKAPIFGENFGLSLVCETWTAGSAPQLKLTADGAPPIVVIGTTGDSATPYQQAVTMSKQLSSGVLLTYEGAGHGASSMGNQCIDQTLSDFFVDGTVPQDGKKCS